MAAILESKFRFAYRIRVENVSDESVQLLGRYWCIQELTVDGSVDDSKEGVVVDSPATGAGTSRHCVNACEEYWVYWRHFSTSLSSGTTPSVASRSSV